MVVKTGEFYDRPLAKSAEIILERSGGTADFEDIVSALTRGGFDTRDRKWVRGILLKNKKFALLPDKKHFILVPKERQRGKSNTQQAIDAAKEKGG